MEKAEKAEIIARSEGSPSAKGKRAEIRGNSRVAHAKLIDSSHLYSIFPLKIGRFRDFNNEHTDDYT